MTNAFIITTGVLFLSWIMYTERRFRKYQFYTYLYLRHKESIDRAKIEFGKMGSTVKQAANACRQFGLAMSNIKIEKL